MSEPDERAHLFSWSMAEELAVTHMRSLGFADARRTPHGPDGGLDAIGTNAAAQVKNYALPVGAPEVQKLRGAGFGRESLFFYAKSGFTAQAEVFADAAGVALFRFTELNQVEAVNQVAKGFRPKQSQDSQTDLDRGQVILARLGAVMHVTGTTVKRLRANTKDLGSLSMTQSDVDELEVRFRALADRFTRWSDSVSEDMMQFSVQYVQDLLDEAVAFVAPVLGRFGLDLDDYSDDELRELTPSWGVSYEQMLADLEAQQSNMVASLEVAMIMKQSWEMMSSVSKDLAEIDNLPPRADGVWPRLKSRITELAERIQTWIDQASDEPTEASLSHGAQLRAEQQGLLAEYCLMFGLAREQVGI